MYILSPLRTYNTIWLTLLLLYLLHSRAVTIGVVRGSLYRSWRVEWSYFGSSSERYGLSMLISNGNPRLCEHSRAVPLLAAKVNLRGLPRGLISGEIRSPAPLMCSPTLGNN